MWFMKLPFVSVRTIILACFVTSLMPQLSIATENISFTGSWVANGTREILPFTPDRQVALFNLSGHVNLENEVGNKKDYWSQCMGIADSGSGITGRCVWRSSDDQEIYLLLEAGSLSKGSTINGTIIGGSGDAEGITGSFKFKWSSMSHHKTNRTWKIGGYAEELTGTYQLP